MFPKISPRGKFRVVSFNTPFRRKTLAYVSDNLYTIRIIFETVKINNYNFIQVCAFSTKQNIIESDIRFFPQPVSDFRNGDKRTTNFLICHSKINTFSIQFFIKTV